MANLFKEKMELTSLRKTVGFLVNHIYLFYFFPFVVLLFFFVLTIFSKYEKQLMTWARLIPEMTFY